MWQYIVMHWLILVSVSLYEPRINGWMVVQRTRASPAAQTGLSTVAFCGYWTFLPPQSSVTHRCQTD